MEIYALCAAWSIPVAPHFMLELTGQLLCTIPNGQLVEDVEGGSFSDLGLLSTPLRVVDGRFTPPAVPGHGIEFNPDALRRCAAPDRLPAEKPGLWQAQTLSLRGVKC